MTHLLILPSPFLGPAPYEPLAHALRDRGSGASVATYDEPPVATALIEQWAEQAAAHHHDVALVAHSNAGLLAPAVSGLLGGLPLVGLDAALPGAGPVTPLAPPDLRDFLAGLAGADGLLPRWTRWWSREDLATTLPGSWFDRLDPVLPRVPHAYVGGSVPVPAGWERGRCGYVAFGGQAYAAEVDRARALGWPVLVLEGAGHLHCLVAPEDTAGAVAEVLSAARQRPGRGR